MQLLAPVEVETLPKPQVWHAKEEFEPWFGLKVPLGQFSQLVAPAKLEKVPVPQGVHVEASYVVENEPGKQYEQLG